MSRELRTTTTIMGMSAAALAALVQEAAELDRWASEVDFPRRVERSPLPPPVVGDDFAVRPDDPELDQGECRETIGRDQ